MKIIFSLVVEVEGLRLLILWRLLPMELLTKAI